MKTYVNNPVIAKYNNYCVPAVLQMLLNHYDIYEFTQDYIANQLVMIPADNNTEHINWGAQITDNTINDFFNNNKINLNECYIPISRFKDCYYFEEGLSGLLQSDISIICGFNYTWLYGNCEDTFRHVSIIVNFDYLSKKVTLLDPGPKEAGYKEVPANKLYQAIIAGKDGLWCITEHSRT